MNIPLPHPEAPPPVCALPLFEDPQENEEMSILSLEILKPQFANNAIKFENHINSDIKSLLLISMKC